MANMLSVFPSQRQSEIMLSSAGHFERRDDNLPSGCPAVVSQTGGSRSLMLAQYGCHVLLIVHDDNAQVS